MRDNATKSAAISVYNILIMGDACTTRKLDFLSRVSASFSFTNLPAMEIALMRERIE